eukprot:2235636-Rhodomonas_salina.1
MFEPANDFEHRNASDSSCVQSAAESPQNEFARQRNVEHISAMANADWETAQALAAAKAMTFPNRLEHSFMSSESPSAFRAASPRSSLPEATFTGFNLNLSRAAPAGAAQASDDAVQHSEAHAPRPTPTPTKPAARRGNLGHLLEHEQFVVGRDTPARPGMRVTLTMEGEEGLEEVVLKVCGGREGVVTDATPDGVSPPA